MQANPLLAIIGGSGLYDMPGLEYPMEYDVTTPFGKPSAPIRVGTLQGLRVAFLARHGIGHHLSPTEVNYRANLYALKALGVRKVVAVSACGSLREDYQPGQIVIPDQLFDFTRKRKSTFFEDGLVAHVGTANPFCPNLSRQVAQALQETGATVHRGGTFITIEGPRFSTRGESNLYRAWGMSIIGMTTSPEAFLAREAELCYTVIAHVTDYDVWHTTEEPVTVEMVMRTLKTSTGLIQRGLQTLSRTLQPENDCECHHALATAITTHSGKITPETRQRLSLLVDKYLK